MREYNSIYRNILTEKFSRTQNHLSLTMTYRIYLYKSLTVTFNAENDLDSDVLKKHLSFRGHIKLQMDHFLK